MVADGDKCFRVSGIPDDYTESQVRALLARELRLDDDVLIEIFSHARNPLRQGERIATLTFSQIPAELSERGQQHIKIPPTSPEGQGPRKQVVLDSHFEGFTPLHTAEDNECYMDIIALSGLNGHAFGSFKAKGGSHMWLRDSLPFDLRKARIFIYGYDTSQDKVSFQNVWDLESTFRDRLRRLRARSDTTRKPFVIVAHSLGGIIAKAAVIKMAESTIEGDDAAYQSLRGTLLFGVPSGGMDIESLVPMVPSSEMRALLSSLDKNNSPMLRELGETFPKRIKELQDFEAFNFYETRELPTARKTDEGNWEMKGPLTVLVTPLSATQGKLGNEPGHRVFALNRTHSEMIKFSGPNDNDYETTLDCLKEIEKRIARETSVWPLHPLSKDEQACLQSLSFLEQHSREFDPKIYASEGTCSWIREHKNYCAWLATSPSLLWIMGPPGAGKSTLMKFLVNSEREARRDRDIIAAFFVHGRGNEIQKSHLGIYRSLLHQLLPYCPGSLAKLTKLYTDRTNIRGKFGRKWTWEEGELRDFFTATIVAESPQRAITIFVDALDEMGEVPAVDLIAHFERLHEKDIPRHSKFRLCFSCRYYPKLAEDGSLSIAVEKENWRDINSLIMAHTPLTSFGRSDGEIMTRLIIERANGIFLWVSLVLDEVMHLRRRRQPAAAVIARIKEVPGTLKGIYDALLVFESENDRKETLKLFQWILFSSWPLGPEDFRQALAIDSNINHTSLEEITQSAYYYQLEDMPTVVQGLSKGLARVTERYPIRVETIHQSVNDYLLESGLKRIAPCVPGKVEEIGHFQLSRSCIKLLHLLSQNGSYDTKPVISDTPLGSYAGCQWMLHVMEVERHDAVQTDLLELLPWRKKCGSIPSLFTSSLSFPLVNRITNHYERYTTHRAVDWIYEHSSPDNDWDPVHLLALAGIQSTLDKMELIEPGIYDRTDRWGHTTLVYALAGSNEKTITSAIGMLTHSHVKNARFVISPLLLAVTHSREDWVQAIINKGADLDHKSRYGSGDSPETFSALCHAFLQEDDRMARQLLDAGADPSTVYTTNSKGSKRGVERVQTTVIHEAVKRDNKWNRYMLPLLIESAINLYPGKNLSNIQDYNGGSTLSYAVDQGIVSLVQLLLNSGVRQDDGYREFRTGITALEHAAERGHEEVVKVLLKDAALLNRCKSPYGLPSSNNYTRRTPLEHAAERGHGEVVKVLLKDAALLNRCKSPYGLPSSNTYTRRTPLELAIDNRHTCVVQAFLEFATKTEINLIRSIPWDWYIQLAVKSNALDIVQILLKSGVDPNTFVSGEKALLHVAAEENYAELARLLLHAGADPTLRDIAGTTVLQTAIDNRNAEIIGILLDWKDAQARTLIMLEISTFRQVAWSTFAFRRDRPSSSIKSVFIHTKHSFDVQDENGFTTLWYAVVENMPDVVDVLLYHGHSNPNTQNHQGKTPLMRASSAGCNQILRLLLAHPLTDITIEDEDGLTAIDHARRAGNSIGVAFLRKRQDHLLTRRQNIRAAAKMTESGRASPLLNVTSSGLIGTLRRHLC